MDPRCKGMPLSSFILKPMQRVTRYPLIIKNVSAPLSVCGAPDPPAPAVWGAQAPVGWRHLRCLSRKSRQHAPCRLPPRGSDLERGP